MKLLHHAQAANTFIVTLNAPAGLVIEPHAATVTAPPGQEVDVSFRVRVANRPAGPIQVVTADIQVGPWDFRQWCEGLLKIRPEPR